MERLQSIEARLKAIVPVSQPYAQPQHLRLVSARTLRVRQLPARDAPVLARLGTNSLVRIIEEKKSWALVEYFDVIAGSTAEGWVSKRFLQKLPTRFVE